MGTPSISSAQPATSTRRRAPRLASAVAASAVVVLLAACSGGGADSVAANDSVAVTAHSAPQPAPDVATEAAAGGEVTAVGAATPAEEDREVITTGSANVLVTDPLQAAADVAALVERSGGRVESRNEWRGSKDDAGSASLRLRIPSAHMTSVIDALGDVGTVQNVDLSRQDVTATGRDLDARIAALTTSTERLTELMARAENVEDLLGVERELSSRQAELDGLRAQRTALSDQVAMSTLDVHLQTERTAGVGPSGFWGGLVAGWNSLLTFGRGALVAVGAALPWLAIAGLVFAGVRTLVVRRRRRRAVAVDAAPAG